MVPQLWLLLKITGLQSIQKVILHFIFGYWEFCDYLLVALAWMLIFYLMTLNECVCVCVCMHWGVMVSVELLLRLSYFLIHVF